MAVGQSEINWARREITGIAKGFLQPVLHVPYTTFFVTDRAQSGEMVDFVVNREPDDAELSSATFEAEIYQDSSDSLTEGTVEGREYVFGPGVFTYSLTEYRFVGRNYAKARVRLGRQNSYPGMAVAKSNFLRSLGSSMLTWTELFNDIEQVRSAFDGGTIYTAAGLTETGD